MEPFGLFHFLQTLLSQNGSKEPTDTTADPQPKNAAPSMTEEETTAATPKMSSSQEAAMEFLYRHEADAKRRKRK